MGAGRGLAIPYQECQQVGVLISSPGALKNTKNLVARALYPSRYLNNMGMTLFRPREDMDIENLRMQRFWKPVANPAQSPLPPRPPYYLVFSGHLRRFARTTLCVCRITHNKSGYYRQRACDHYVNLCGQTTKTWVQSQTLLAADRAPSCA